MPRAIPRTAFRVAGVFILVLGLFGVTLAVTLLTFHGISNAEEQVAELDEAKQHFELAMKINTETPPSPQSSNL